MDVDILGAYWTTCGPVEIHYGREWSLFDWPERCAQAAKSGLRGLGIWHADLLHQLERRSLADIKRIFDDAGLQHLELEFLNDWFVDEGTEERAASDEARALLWDAAAALDAHHIKVGNLRGTPSTLPQVTDRFAELCQDAAQHHQATLTYELIPFDMTVHDLTALLTIVENAPPNGGVALDFWHLGKLGITPEELRRIPRERLLYVELSDGQIENMADGSMETTMYRRLPGEGEFDVRGYVRVLQELGYPGPWGVEVLSVDLRALPLPEMYDRTYQTSLSQFLPAPAQG
jgi:sugar phosphate isomerase/epimerase